MHAMAGTQKSDRSFRLSWKDGLTSPCREMVRGAAAVDGNIAYFSTTTSRTVYAYNSVTDDWRSLPKCPAQYFALAVIDGVLTAVGGFRSINPTPDLYSLVAADAMDAGKKAVEGWAKVYPPMPTKRGEAAVVCSGRYLVVAGGKLAVVSQIGGILKTVEMMDIVEKTWYSVSSLPKAIAEPSMTLCDDTLYLMGSWIDDDRSRSVFSCSLQDLIRSKCSTSPPSSTRTSSFPWYRIADTPDFSSTAASLSSDVLLAVGGCDDEENSVTSVYRYDTARGYWKIVGNMATPRYRAVVAVVSGDTIIVVGGCSSANGDFNGTAEIAMICDY